MSLTKAPAQCRSCKKGICAVNPWVKTPRGISPAAHISPLKAGRAEMLTVIIRETDLDTDENPKIGRGTTLTGAFAAGLGRDRLSSALNQLYRGRIKLPAGARQSVPAKTVQ